MALMVVIVATSIPYFFFLKRFHDKDQARIREEILEYLRRLEDPFP